MKTDQPRMGLAALEENQRGDATDAVGGGQFGRVVDVELAHLDLALKLPGQLLEPGCQRTAGAQKSTTTGPGSVAIKAANDSESSAAVLVEVAVSDMTDTFCGVGPRCVAACPSL